MALRKRFMARANALFPVGRRRRRSSASGAGVPRRAMLRSLWQTEVTLMPALPAHALTRSSLGRSLCRCMLPFVPAYPTSEQTFTCWQGFRVRV